MRSSPQSFLRQPLSAVFAHGSHVRVLRELARHGGELTVSTLIDRTGLTRPSVLAALKQIADLGFVEALGASHRLYRIDHRHPLASALSALFAAEEARFRAIMDALRNAATSVGAIAAWLYGSVARGEDGSGSDIDIVIVTTPGDAESAKAKLRERLRNSEDELRFSVSVIVLDQAEIMRLAQDHDPWWLRMIEDATPLAGLDPATILTRLSTSHRASA